MLAGIKLPIPGGLDYSRLNRGVIGRFTKASPTRICDRHQLIIQPDDKLNSIYMIKSGFVRQYDISANGDEHVLWYGRTGDIFPSPRLFDNSYQNAYFFDAFSDCRLRVIDADELSRYVEDHNRALIQITRYLAYEREATELRLQALAESKASSKVIRILDFLVKRFGVINKRRQVTVKLPLTHQDIANFIGVTRETVSHELSKLKNAGVIDYHKTGIGVNATKLARYLDET